VSKVKGNWMGARCFLAMCPGEIGFDRSPLVTNCPAGVYWECSTCGRRDYASVKGWDFLPPDGPHMGPPS
jgi:hypothetical protein